MAMWGANDSAIVANSSTTVLTTNGAPLWTHALVKGGGTDNAHFANTSGTRASVTLNMFGNTTADAFVTGQKVGVFGVSSNEVGVMTGNLISGTVTDSGYGYWANATVTLRFANGSTNATAVNAHANSTGYIDSILIKTNGGYSETPQVIVSDPPAINITANTTGFSNTTNVLLVASANTKFKVGDRVLYTVPTDNTAITDLTGNAYYYVVFANTTALALSATSGGANVDITSAETADPGEVHTLTNMSYETATGVVTVSGGKNRGIAHTGWVLRKEGTGGRAGRVHYEVLVAGNIASDASEDTILPDA